MALKYKLLTICTFLLSNGNSFAQFDEIWIDTIEVSTATEFIDNIASNTVLLLKPGVYDFSLLENMLPTSYYEFLTVYDSDYEGSELLIKNISNFSIVGTGNKAGDVELLTRPRYGSVLIFNDCRNISIKNVKAGHSPEKGECLGGVFEFRFTTGISLSNCLLYGSGIRGLTLQYSARVYCEDVDIYGCSSGIASFTNTNRVTFNNCRFYDNGNIYLFEMEECIKIEFLSCSIQNNRIDEPDEEAMEWIENMGLQPDSYVFSLKNSENIYLQDCIIEDNTAWYFANEKAQIELLNTDLSANNFKKGVFPDE